MIFIDANVFLAYNNTRDLLHKQAQDIWKRIEAKEFGEACTSDYVLNEVVGVTLRKQGKEKAVLLGIQIQKTIPLINIDDHLLKKAWTLFEKTSYRLNLVDCTNIIVVEALKAESIATLDKEFKKTKLQIIS